MHNIKANFDKILVVIKDILGDEINKKGNYVRRGTRPRFSDIESNGIKFYCRMLKHR